MNALTMKNENQVDKNSLSLFRYNKRILWLILTKNFITKEQHTKIHTILKKDIQSGTQIPVEGILESYQLASSELVTKEQFKYNQIIIKLAHQFVKNTTVQQLKIEEADENSSKRQLAGLDNWFKELLTLTTDHYLKGFQKNIDDILLETGLFASSQLAFFHNGAMHLEIKALDRKFGEIAIQNRFSTKEVITRALLEQTELYLKTNKNHIIGDILVNNKEMAPETRDEILLLQNRVLVENWEDTLKRVGQSVIEEQEKNALFGAMVIKENLIKEDQVIEALKIQNREREAYERQKREKTHTLGEAVEKKHSPRWIGDILVNDFGLPEKERQKIVKKQMQQKIERINLKFGINLKDAQRELFHELDTYFQLLYSKNKLHAYIKLTKKIPNSMTKDNIILWLYHKKIIYGRINTAILQLLNQKVEPGDKIVVAKGDPPVPESFVPIFYFNREDGPNTSRGIPLVVSKGTKLVALNRTPGKSGTDVNRCFISPNRAAYSILKGANVIRENNTFLAGCDGAPKWSEKGVISVSSLVIISGDLTKKSPPISHDCDIEVNGTIETGVTVKCRKLTVQTLKGLVFSTDDVVVQQKAADAQINTKGNITAAAIRNGKVTSEKNIVIQTLGSSKAAMGSEIKNAVVSSNNICTIIDSSLSSSIIRARNKIIIRESTIGTGCKFIVGDSSTIIASKIKIEKIANEMQNCKNEIRALQSQIRELFNTIEKKDISDIENQIDQLNKQQPKTKDDLDRLRELKMVKRKKEKENGKKYNDYGDRFVDISNTMNTIKKRRADLIKEKQGIEKKIAALYKRETVVTEIDARRATIPRGSVFQFRHTKEKIDSDCTGFIFREEFNNDTHVHEIRRHRW